MGEAVYKITTEAAFEEDMRRGRFDGSADDLRDGFSHLSARHQVEDTLAAHFSGQDDLVLLALDVVDLSEALKWETSRGGALFPHFYGPLDLAQVRLVESLPLGDDGLQVLPEGISA